MGRDTPDPTSPRRVTKDPCVPPATRYEHRDEPSARVEPAVHAWVSAGAGVARARVAGAVAKPVHGWPPSLSVHKPSHRTRSPEDCDGVTE